MAVMLGYKTLDGVLSMREAIDLLERAFAHEVGNTTYSMRCSPAAQTDIWYFDDS